MRTYRGAVIGCGYFAANHLNAWRDLAPRAELAAVCDRDPEKARAASAAFGATAYTDAAEMFAKEKLDFVDVVTTMPTHRALVMLALEHRVPTIVQKPFAPNWEDCVAMVEAAKAAGVPLMVHENFRFQTPMMRAREILASGEIGEPVWGSISFRTGYDVYANQPYLAEEEDLIILDLGIHILDLARVFLGEVETVFCESQRVNPRVRAEDQATMLLRHVGGAVSVIDCSYESRRVPDVFPQTLMHLEGRKGSISVLADFELLIGSGGQERREQAGPKPLAWASGAGLVVQESVLNTCAHWLDSLDRGVDPDTSGMDNLKTYALTMAAYTSARSGASAKPPAWTPGAAIS